MEQDIGIIIPTKNRLEWCKLRAKYHSLSGFQGKILFVDSSDTNPNIVFSEFLSRNNFENVQLLHLPNSGVHQAIEFGLQYIQPNCKYVAVSGDDDFHLPSGLRAAGQFLDSNMDYFSVAGPAITLSIEASGDKFTRKTISKYWDEFSILDELEPNRFREIVQNYHNLEFSLKRTNGYLEIMKELNRAFQDHSFDSSRAVEYCASIAIALEGKGGWIDNYFLIRGDHHGRPNSFPELNDLNKNSQFFPMRNAKLLSLINSRYTILLKSLSTSEIHDLIQWAPKVELEYGSHSILTKKISGLFSKIRAHLSSFKLRFLYRRFLAWIK